MSFLNILIWILGGIIIAIYLFFQIRKYIKWKKIFNEEMKKDGMTTKQAKQIANSIIYKKKKRKEKKENEEKEDIIFEE